MALTSYQQQQLEYFKRLKERGAQMLAGQVRESGTVPADLGLFGGSTFPAFELGKSYEKGEVFSYGGNPGYIKQAHTSQESWIPFTAGTEALYGARPKMNGDGTFPYLYNMAAAAGMRVWGEDGHLYQCIQDIPDMLWPPEDIPAHFERMEAEG